MLFRGDRYLGARYSGPFHVNRLAGVVNWFFELKYTQVFHFLDCFHYTKDTFDDNDNFFHFFTIFLSISQKSHLQIFIEFLSQLVTFVFVEWAPALNDNCPCFRWQLPLLRTCSLEVPLKESTCWSTGQTPPRPLSSFGLGKSSPEIRYSWFYQDFGSYFRKCKHWSHFIKVVQFDNVLVFPNQSILSYLVII